ncbi:MAG: UDP-3-O-(3-hydroxymyristoyl)glucosamine N-acyltransferase [Bacillota bacterium]
MTDNKKSYRAVELAKIVKGELFANSDKIINGVSSAKNPQKNTVVFAENEKYLKIAEKNGAELIITSKDLDSNFDLIKVENPRLAYASIASLFREKDFEDIGIDNSAVIADNVKIEKEVQIGANAVIEKGVFLGENVTIAPGVFIAKNVSISAGTIIYPNVVIEKDSKIGKNVIIHSGTVIGADGFGYVKDGDKQRKIPQLGSVIIEDDVEIGANATIDRATNGDTIIKRGTKIDNLVQIAHNVEIGEDSIIVSQVGIAGSVKLGNQVTIAGQAGIIDHKKIGKNSIVAAKSLVTKDLKADGFYSGNPAQKHRKELKKEASLRKTPKLIKEIKNMKEKIKKLEEELK